jgi:tetratricopeptide (TPR) repeat protein
MKWTLALVGLLFGIWVLIPSIVLPQSDQETGRLYSQVETQYNEANALAEKAQTNTDLEQAVHKYQEALAICQRLEFKPGTAAILNSLGLIYERWGQYEKAVDYYEKSLAMKKELKDRSGELRSLGNLGNVYLAWSQNDKAAEYYEKSLAISRELKDRLSEGKGLHNLGHVYEVWGQ